ncbi:MAG: VWA domain-containing protein [Specibacter sp.]
MTLLPVLPPWLFWPLAAVLLGATVVVLALRGRKDRWRFALLVLLVVAAAARPGVAGGTAPAAATDLDVFFVVDTTASAAAEDYDGAKTRLGGMKADINAIAAELAGARFSLITFDSKAKVVLPLTGDATALRTLTEVVTIQSTYASRGSTISAAREALAGRLAAAAKVHPQRPRLVFYLGDGEQTAAEAPQPFTEGIDLIDGGAVLGYGTAAGGRMRESSGGNDGPGTYIVDPASPTLADARSVIDEKQLRAVAGQLGVPYVHRSVPGDIAAALVDAAPRAADNPESGDGDRPGRVELAWLLAVAAFGLALWELFVSGRAYRELPRKPGAGS